MDGTIEVTTTPAAGPSSAAANRASARRGPWRQARSGVVLEHVRCRRDHPVGDPCPGHHPPVGVDRHRLDRGGADVDPDGAARLLRAGSRAAILRHAAPYGGSALLGSVLLSRPAGTLPRGEGERMPNARPKALVTAAGEGPGAGSPRRAGRPHPRLVARPAHACGSTTPSSWPSGGAEGATIVVVESDRCAGPLFEPATGGRVQLPGRPQQRGRRGGDRGRGPRAPAPGATPTPWPS